MRLNDSAAGPELVPVDATQPKPGPGELLIRVSAAGVTSAELLWYPTSHTRSGEPRKGAIPGHEFSGVVAAAAEKVDDSRLGRAVFGMNDWYSDGAMAEYCVAPAAAVTGKPERLSHAEAASVPIPALTAWQGLMERARLKAGERVLVQGGAGAVGVFAVQLARLHGAAVVATASQANAAFVTELGAEQVVDYRAVGFEEAVAPVDVVFDTVGGETLARSWSLLKPGGRMVTIASGAANSTDQAIQEAFFIVEPNAKQLETIAGLLEGGQLRAVVDAVVPLARAGEAFAGKVERRHRGKVVVAVAGAEEK